MRWAAMACGLACGALNYALLAVGCGRILARNKRGALWVLGGVLCSATGLYLCASISPALLPWFGCACGGALTLLALGHMIKTIASKD